MTGPNARPVAAEQPSLTLRAAHLPWRWVAAAVVLLVAAAVTGILSGPVGVPARGILAAAVNFVPGVRLETGLTDQHAAIVWQLRLPRVVLGGLVGGMLAIAGAGYQGVFRNPLADPYLLGVAAGAGLGATLAIVSDAAHASIPVAAFIGAVAGVAATYLLGSTVGGRTPASLILAGVAVAAFLTAIQTFVQQRHADTLREVYGWLLGRLLTAGWDDVLLILPYVAVSMAVLVAHRRLLDALSVGNEEAQTMGVPTTRVRLFVVVAATLGTAAAVSVSGLIGFVGIVVPHTVRLLAGHSYRVIMPLSFIVGAGGLILADVVARTAIAPGELPIGVVTAFIGAPFFLLVLRHSRSR